MIRLLPVIIVCFICPVLFRGAVQASEKVKGVTVLEDQEHLLTDKVFSIALSSDSQLILAGYRRGEARVWDAARCKVKYRLTGGGGDSDGRRHFSRWFVSSDRGVRQSCLSLGPSERQVDRTIVEASGLYSLALLFQG
jgi:hypothetical protein